MKTIFILFLAFTLSSGYILSADDPRCCEKPCYNNDSCSTPGAWIYAQDEVVVPEFPNCTLTVEYCWRECQANTPHTIQIKICKIHFLHPCQQCDAILSFIRIDGDLSTRRCRMLHTYIIKQITLDKFVFWYSNASQEMKDLVECGTGYHVKYQWWNGSCSAWCYYTTKDGMNTYAHLSPITCTDLYCCGLQLKYCYNSQTGQVERTEERLQYPLVDCSQIPKLPLTSCPDGFDKEVSDCEDSCEDDN